jgi:hypothetical protein
MKFRDSGQVLNQLKLRLFFSFVAAGPIAVVQVFAPRFMVVRTDAIIVVSYFFLLVEAWHRNIMLQTEVDL